jgi:hypothetical protein
MAFRQCRYCGEILNLRGGVYADHLAQHKRQRPTARLPDTRASRKRREQVLEAQGYRCAECGRDISGPYKAQLHHPDRDPWNPEARTVGLCVQCHDSAHHG